MRVSSFCIMVIVSKGPIKKISMGHANQKGDYDNRDTVENEVSDWFKLSDEFGPVPVFSAFVYID